MPRIERDSLGELAVPDDVLYGIQTLRALRNFPVSGTRAHPELVRAYLLLKKAAAQVNAELGKLDPDRAGAIVRAADEGLSGRFADQFVIDAFQAGAGTSLNMNVNEVLANRGLEILGRARGSYEFLHPNDHVNMAQSSNDTYPTAVHIAVHRLSGLLLDELGLLAEAFDRKAAAFAGIAKAGRTHLVDALPMTLGDEFRAYGAALKRSADRITQRRQDLLELAVGGTAVGTGANAGPEFRERMVRRLSELCRAEFRAARDSFEALQSRAQLAAFSSALRELALELTRIANDLRLLSSGPFAGLAEIALPAVQPGSSIMPGKVNPSLPECLNMIAFQVAGNDLAIALATQAGQLELNVMVPVIAHNLLQSLGMLTSFLPVFRTNCLAGIAADPERCRRYLQSSPALAALLVPGIGHDRAVALARESLERRKSIPELAIEKGILSESEARELFGPQGPAQRAKEV